MEMGTDMVSSAAPVSQEVVAREKVSRKGGGEAFAALLQGITSARVSLQEESIRSEMAVPPEIGAEKPAKKALLDRLFGKQEEREENTPVLAPWLLSDLFAGQGTSEPGFAAEMELQRLIQEVLPGQAGDAGNLLPGELFLLEQRLVSGEIPLLDEKGFLTPEAGSVIFSYLGEAEVVEKLQSFFLELDGKGISWDTLQATSNMGGNVAGEQFIQEGQLKSAGMPVMEEGNSPATLASSAVSNASESPAFLPQILLKGEKVLNGLPLAEADFMDVEVAGEKADPPPLLERLEGFLRSLLSGRKVSLGEMPPADGLEEGLLPEFALDGEGTLGNPPSGGDFVSPSGNRPDETSVTWQASTRFNSVPPREIAAQIADRLTLLTRPGEQELRMKLQPEFLGEILIRMKRIRGVLTAEIITQNIAVKELLEGQMDALRQRFQQMEMHVEEFHVLLNSEKNGEGGGGAGKHSSGSGPGGSAPKGAYGHGKDSNFNGGYEENGRINYLA